MKKITDYNWTDEDSFPKSEKWKRAVSGEGDT